MIRDRYKRTKLSATYYSLACATDALLSGRASEEDESTMIEPQETNRDAVLTDETRQVRRARERAEKKARAKSKRAEISRRAGI